jgi:hypothetical protein
MTFFRFQDYRHGLDKKWVFSFVAGVILNYKDYNRANWLSSAAIARLNGV